MVIHIGTAGIPLSTKGHDTLSGIKRIVELKLDAMELQFVRQVYIKEKEAIEIRKYAEKEKVVLSCHGSYFLNLASQKEKTIADSRRRILDALKIAETLGARIVVIHAGYYSGRGEKGAYELIKDSLKDVFHEFKGKTKIGVETMGRQKSFGTIDEIIGLSSEIKNVVPVIDFGHIHARENGGLMSKKDFQEIFDRFEKALGLKEFHIHMTCVKYAGGNEKNHLPLSAKEPDYSHLASILKENRYNATIISESPILETDALLFKKMLNS